MKAFLDRYNLQLPVCAALYAYCRADRA